MTITQKAKWIFVKSKIATRNVALNSSKLTLGLFLHTLDFAEGEEIESHTREAIGDMIAETEWTKSKFLKAERIDQLVAKAYDACRCSKQETGEHSIEHDATCVVLQLPNNRFHSQQKSSLVLENSIAISDNGNPDTGVLNLSATTKSLWQSEEVSEIGLLDGLSNENFLHIAQHLRTQQTVSSYALIVLDGNQDKHGMVEIDTASRTETGSSHRSKSPVRDSKGKRHQSDQELPTKYATSSADSYDQQSLHPDDIDESLVSDKASTDPSTNTDHQDSAFSKRAHKDRTDHYTRPSLRREHERFRDNRERRWVRVDPSSSVPRMPNNRGKYYDIPPATPSDIEEDGSFGRYPPPGSNPQEDPEIVVTRKEIAEIRKEKEKRDCFQATNGTNAKGRGREGRGEKNSIGEGKEGNCRCSQRWRKGGARSGRSREEGGGEGKTNYRPSPKRDTS
ncbi:hypothetical protein F4825DRAFT_444418 [Nemania diffusa]|nr:hypothetical protein F4825DRAFT_444418 [Nemania diffusa]